MYACNELFWDSTWISISNDMKSFHKQKPPFHDSHGLGSEWVSEQCGASEWVSDAGQRANARWFRTAKNQDVCNGLVRLLVYFKSLAPLSHSLALHCLLCSHAQLTRSIALTYLLAGPLASKLSRKWSIWCPIFKLFWTTAEGSLDLCADTRQRI